MMSDEWWDRWCILWYAVGWRARVARENFNLDDTLDVVAALLAHIARLELRTERFPSLGLF